MKLFAIRIFTDTHGRRWWAVCDAHTGEAIVICSSYQSARTLL